MKKFYLSLCLLLFFCMNNSFAQIPSYSLQLKNLILVDSKTVTFDIEFTHTNSSVWETAAWQYFFRVNSDFFSGGTVTFAYDSLGGDAVSDLPDSFRPRNPQVVVAGNYPGYHELRLAGNNVPGAGNGLIIPQNVPTLIGRMKLKSSNNLDQSFGNFVIRDSCDLPVSITRTKLTTYIGVTNTEVTRCADHSVNLFFAIPPTTLFSSPNQIITMGQSASFIDESYNNPTAWKWQFPGGIPSSSSSQNPTGIVYNLPGYYDVTLISTNSFGSDTLKKTAFIKSNTLCPFTWQTNIIASDNGNKSDSIKIGMSSVGTNLLDTCLGEYIIPPVPPNGIFDFRSKLSNGEFVKTDFRNDTLKTSTWKLNFQPSTSGYPMTFSWNISEFPSYGFFYLKDSLGTLVNVNMRNQSSYVLTSSALSNLNIIYISDTTKTISVLKGWNLVSVPLLLQNMAVTSIFPNATSPAYSFNNGYLNSPILENGKGYWLKFDTARNYSLDGQFVNLQQMNVTNSWNLIGPFDKDMPVNSIVSNPSGLISSYFFGFNDGYIIADTLRAGKGYWIRSTGNGNLENGSFDNDNGNTVQSFENMVSLNFSDESGKSIQLYMTNKSGIVELAQLPPVPPTGVFDVRYSTGNFVESSDKNQIIQISSIDRPVKFKISNLEGNKFRIKDNIDGSILNMELTENEEITINPALDNFTIINESQIPQNYELSQNYPNPFNPSTKIMYQLPEEGKVKIIIYNVLGKEVYTLVNSVQQAGRYEVNFNASDLSSGVYFYRLESGNFTDLKRMILLK